MNVFVIHSGSDFEIVSKKIDFLRRDNFNFNALVLENGNKLWKIEALEKIKKSQMVIFYVGEKSYSSPYIAWELKMAMKYNKPIYTVKLKPENLPHPNLTCVDDFSGKLNKYDIEVTEEKIDGIIKNYENSDYNVFNQSVQDIDKGILLEQYKAFLQTSEDLVSRRQGVSNFYISINSALIAIFSALLAFGIPNSYKLVIGLMFATVGLILSVSWIKTLVSYGNLNGSKMKIISCIEKQLPASLYDAEWAALSDKLNKKKYVSFTESEKNIPRIFIVVYVSIFIGIICFKIFS